MGGGIDEIRMKNVDIFEAVNEYLGGHYTILFTLF